jgi:predicted DNA-binding transcriptional regulator AlpA
VIDERILDMLLDELADRVAVRLGHRETRGTSPAPAGDAGWRLLNVDEVGAMLGRSKRSVHSYVKERGLPYIRLDSGALAFDPDDVKAWAKARRVPAAEADPLASRWQTTGESASANGSGNGRRPAMPKAEAS